MVLVLWFWATSPLGFRKERGQNQVLMRVSGNGHSLTRLVGVWKGAATLWNHLAVSIQAKRIRTLRPSHSTPVYIPDRNKASSKITWTRIFIISDIEKTNMATTEERTHLQWDTAGVFKKKKSWTICNHKNDSHRKNEDPKKHDRINCGVPFT